MWVPVQFALVRNIFQAIEAGSQFIFSPGMTADLLAVGKEYDYLICQRSRDYHQMVLLGWNTVTYDQLFNFFPD